VEENFFKIIEVSKDIEATEAQKEA